jgi:hypothetical protein
VVGYRRVCHRPRFATISLTLPRVSHCYAYRELLLLDFSSCEPTAWKHLPHRCEMGFNVFSDSGQAFYFAFLIVTGIIGLAALILRFVASRVSHRKFGWEDILAAAAVAVFLTRTAVGLRGECLAHF